MCILVVDKDDLNENGNVVMIYKFIDDLNGFFRIDCDLGVILMCMEFD